jgi:hypothetical protein
MVCFVKHTLRPNQIELVGHEAQDQPCPSFFFFVFSLFLRVGPTQPIQAGLDQVGPAWSLP